MLLSEAGSVGLYFLAPWVVFFPVIGLLVNIAVGHRLREKAIGTVASAASGLAFAVSVLLALSLGSHPETVRWTLGEWIHSGSLQLDWVFRVDTLSVTMMLVVSGVGTLIHVYAIGYMHEDVRFKADPGRFRRFFVFLNLFIAAMMILVSGDSYLMLFVGWEGVGLCSFLLIGFWYEMDTLGRPSWANSEAAKKAMIANRIGDFGFLIAAFLMFTAFGSLQFDAVFDAAGSISAINSPLIILITLFLLLGVAGKSAQIPLYVWLPDAMAGPTPVSALIHAATMVTAGVYLVARSAPLYVAAPTAQLIVATLGAVTALFAATIAVGQFDIKKVLAYSTISQLGFMVAGVGMGAFAGGMFHLVTHAFFKALLFLSAGSIILGLERGHHHMAHGHGQNHAAKSPEVFDPNDMRNMGGMRKSMPVTFWLYTVGTLALAGIPPLAGFWSKDEILADALREGFILVYWLLTAAAFFTAFYMGRQIWMVFFGKARHEAAAKAEESPAIITAPLMVLAGLSLAGGALNLPRLHTLAGWLEHTIETIQPGEFLPQVALLSTGLALLAIVLSWLLYGRSPMRAGQTDPLQRMLGPLFTGMNRKWFVDEAYRTLFLDRYVQAARFLADVIDTRFLHDWFHEKVIAGTYNFLSGVALNRYADQRGIDGFFNGLGQWTQDLSSSLRRVQNGFVRSYALVVLVGVVAMLGYLLLK
ncbi:MAG: NADH-quinone oxidoreductase subunit L [Chloroflexota bacterium]